MEETLDLGVDQQELPSSKI